MRALEWSLVPVVVVAGLWATAILLAAGASPFVVTAVVVGVAAAIFAILERLHPERRDWIPFDQPLWIDAAHYILDYHFGIFLGYGASYLIAFALRLPHAWPSRWPLALQIALAAFISEGVSYWQHRAAHRFAWLWRFHALHHSGARLNLVRAGRFHFVNVSTATFLTFAPLVVLGAPEDIVTAISVLSGLNGVLTHSNVRMRTPRWIDWFFCTPAMHRQHHSIDLRESDANFGTTLVLFDWIFGTYRAPAGPAPATTGIADAFPPRGFFAQVIAPFRARRALTSPASPAHPAAPWPPPRSRPRGT
jgi:sterol desaturase/sphingolipid hydroxylase (fatty acid hydroxylase superfamily)